MITQNLIIYKFNTLYHILEELDLDLNFEIIFVDSENSLNKILSNLSNYLIISNQKYANISKIIDGAVKKYKSEVLKKIFPKAKHSFKS